MYPDFANSGDGPRLSLYRSAPYGPTLYGVRDSMIGYRCDSSLGTYTAVNSRTPSRIGIRNSYLVYWALTCSMPWAQIAPGNTQHAKAKAAARTTDLRPIMGRLVSG